MSNAERRFAEAERLGFTTVIAPARAPEGPSGLRVVRVGDLADAMRAAGLA